MKTYIKKLGNGFKEIAVQKKSRYGIYYSVNGLTYSENRIKDFGFKEFELTKEQIKRIERKNAKILLMDAIEYNKAKMADRKKQVEICLNSSPVEISTKEGQICPTANLADTPMIEAYHGCGKGTAYIKEGKVIAWHYGHEKPDNAPDCENVHVDLSCTQICFI